jgi:tape measure domain-containing protein
MEGGDQLMGTVDDRVVNLSFNNKQFENAAMQSMSTLDKLKQSLNFSSSTKGVDQLAASVKGVQMDPLATSVEGVSGKFLALATVGVTALATITNMAVQAGLSITKSLTIAPIGAGFHEYELKMGAIQTIMAGSGESLKTVNKYLNELNQYSDRTIYSFSDMTQNIGKFTNAGVNLKTAVAAIQGIANVAALSGANAEEASRAMYNFAQSLSKGSVALIDWKSIEFANMATVEFKTNLLNAAVATGTLTKKGDQYLSKKGTLITATKGFNDSLTEEWLTTKVLTDTLGDYASQTTKIGEKANAAAQDVKTWSQLLSTLQESAGSGWATSFEIIFGNLTEAKSLWTSLNNVIGGFIQSSSDSRNFFLNFFKWVGGFKAISGAIKSWIAPIIQAWKDIFPPAASRAMQNVAYYITKFFEKITLNAGQMQYLREAFQGFFSILRVGASIVKEAFGFLVDMFKLFTAGAPAAGNGLITLVGHIGQSISAFTSFITATNAIPAFFDRLYNAVGPNVVKLREFVSTVAAAVGGALGQLPGMLDQLRGAATNVDQQGLTPMQKTINFLKAAWDGLVVALQNVVSFFGTAGQTIKDAFTGATSGTGDPGTSLVDRIKKAFESVNWANVFKATIAVALMAMIINTIRFFMSLIGLMKAVIDAGKTFISFVEGLSKTLKTLQNNVRANTIVKIALAILLLAISIKILSTIPLQDLLTSLAVIYILFEMLDTFSKEAGKNNANIAKAAGSMVLMALALDLLAVAVLAFGNMDIDVLRQGLASVVVVLGTIMLLMNLLPKSGQFVAAGAGIMLMAQALVVLGAAVFMFGNMDIDVLRQGLAAVVVMLGTIMLLMNLLPPEGKMMAAGAGIVLMALALNLLVIPVKLLGSMDVDQLNEGLKAVIILLGIMAIAMDVMSSPGVFAGAAGMLLAAAALLVMAGVVKIFADMTLDQIVQGLLGIVGVMIVVAAAASGLSFAIPFITAFGLAIMALGAGFALLGIGMLAGATAFSIVLGLMSLGIPILEDMIKNFIALLPLIGEAFYQALTTGAETVIRATPIIVQAFVTLVEGLLEAFTGFVPELMDALRVLLDAMIRVMIEFIPDLADAGWQMLLGLLKGLEDHIGDITETAINIVTKFLQAVEKRLPELITAGTNVIIAWIKGMGEASARIVIAAGETLLTFINECSNWVENNKERINTSMKKLGQALIDGVVAGIDGLGSGIGDALMKAAQDAWYRITHFWESHSPSRRMARLGSFIMQGLIKGVASGKQQAVDQMTNIATEINDSIKETADNISTLKNTIKNLEADKTRTAAQNAALKKAKQDLAAAEAFAKKLAAAKKTIAVEHRADILKLYAYGAQYDKLQADLDVKKKLLDDAQRLYDDYAKSITDKYSNLPAIEATTSLDEYFNAIRDATAANIKFKATMEQLRSLGLDDNQYKKFMEQGTEIQPFLDQLLASGGSTIAELNKIDSSLLQSATDLGKSGADALYKAGVDAAQGLVDGLQAQMDVLTAKMTALGAAIAAELKRELGINSPSKVFSEIGKNTMLGLAAGMDQNSKVIDISARRTGQIAVDSLKKSLAGLAIDEAIDVQPVIAPVLDLNSFRKDAAGIDGILSSKALEATVSAQNARSISTTTEANRKALADAAALQTTGTIVELTQINNSPKALSQAEIYRQTKNQLSTLKEALNI